MPSHLENTASKGQSGRVIPMNDELRTALAAYAKTTVIASSSFLIESERSNRMSAQAIVNLVLAMVPTHRLRRLLQSQWATYLYYQHCTEDLDSRRLVARCPDARWTHQPSDHTAIHRGQSGSADEDRGACLKRHDLRCFTYGEPRLALSATESLLKLQDRTYRLPTRTSAKGHRPPNLTINLRRSSPHCVQW